MPRKVWVVISQMFMADFGGKCETFWMKFVWGVWPVLLRKEHVLMFAGPEGIGLCLPLGLGHSRLPKLWPHWPALVSAMILVLWTLLRHSVGLSLPRWVNFQASSQHLFQPWHSSSALSGLGDSYCRIHRGSPGLPSGRVDLCLHETQTSGH